MYSYMLRGDHPRWSGPWTSIVQHGLAQFVVENGSSLSVQIKEPLTLVSIMRYLDSQRHTLGRFIYDGIRQGLHESRKGIPLEQAVLIAITRLLRDGKKALKDVFQFHGSAPSWAERPAQLVAQVSTGNYQPFDLITGDPPRVCDRVSCRAMQPEDVRKWLADGGAGWCIPGEKMGPDLMTWVRLGGEEVLLLVIQAKCHLNRNLATITSGAAANASRSLNPGEFFRSLVCKLLLASVFASLLLHPDHRQAEGGNPEAETVHD